jgi:hypothetical protein
MVSSDTLVSVGRDERRSHAFDRLAGRAWRGRWPGWKHLDARAPSRGVETGDCDSLLPQDA